MQNRRFATVRLSTGPQIYYAEQGGADGEPVVLLHGWPDSWFTFSLVLPLLPSRLRVVVPDQRGFGESDRPDSGYTFDDFAADAVALLDALEIDQDRLLARIRGADLTVYPETGHCPNWERPERVASDLQAFVTQR